MHQKHVGQVAENSAWYARDLRDDPSWIYTLNDDETSEIRNAVALVEQQGLALNDLDKDNFKLPLLSRKLEGVSDQLEPRSNELRRS